MLRHSLGLHRGLGIRLGQGLGLRLNSGKVPLVGSHLRSVVPKYPRTMSIIPNGYLPGSGPASGSKAEPTTLDAVHRDLGLSRFLTRVYSTTGAGMCAGLGTATLLSQLGPSMWVLGTGFVGAMGSVIALSRMNPVYVDHQTTFKGSQFREKVLRGPPGRTIAYGALCTSMGAVMAPMVSMSSLISPTILPVATCLSVATMAGASLFAYMKPEGSLLTWGAPLSGALTGFVGLGLLSLGSQLLLGTNVFSDIWYHVDTYGGIALFSALIAYDTHLSVEAYRSGTPDHIGCATSLYLNFVNLLIRIMSLRAKADK